MRRCGVIAGTVGAEDASGGGGVVAARGRLRGRPPKRGRGRGRHATRASLADDMYVVVDVLESKEYGFGRLDGVLMMRCAVSAGAGAGAGQILQFHVVDQNLEDAVRRFPRGDDLQLKAR